MGSRHLPIVANKSAVTTWPCGWLAGWLQCIAVHCIAYLRGGLLVGEPVVQVKVVLVRLGLGLDLVRHGGGRLRGPLGDGGRHGARRLGRQHLLLKVFLFLEIILRAWHNNT
jgi:hypothetical protein